MRFSAARIVVLMVCGSLLFAGCKETVKTPVPEHDPLTVERTGKEAREAEEKKEKEKVEKMLKAHKKDHGDILIGGCKESCEAPKDAFRNYVRALFDVQDKEAPVLQRYIDVSMLVDNGEELGRHWADMWVAGARKERSEEVAAWYLKYDARCGTAPGGRSAVDESLETAVVFRRISSKVVEFEYSPPALQDDSVSENWRIRMGMRGLEWLVQEIYDGN